jgi:PAS domain S-box-containing protein
VINMADDRFELMERIGDGLFVTDDRLRVVFWNRAAEELTGFSRSDMKGRRCFDRDALNPRTLSGAPLPADGALSPEGPGALPLMIRMDSKDGAEIVASLSLWPLLDGDGQTVGSIGILRDMGEEYRRRKLAGEIQARIVRTGTVVRAGLRIDALRLPMDDVGGDYIEAFFLDGDVLIGTVAETAGRGISSVLTAMVYGTLLHGSFSRLRKPGEVLANVNRGFLETAGTEGDPLGACLLSVDAATGASRWASAGHPAALLFCRDGGTRRLKESLATPAFRLGIEEDADFPEIGFQMERGDLLLVGSDGLYGSQCVHGGPFGTEGAVRFLSGYRGDDPLADLGRAVRRESPFDAPPDDLSALAVTRL